MCEIRYFRWYKQIFNYHRLPSMGYLIEEVSRRRQRRQKRNMRWCTRLRRRSISSRVLWLWWKDISLEFLAFVNIRCSLSFHLTVILPFCCYEMRHCVTCRNSAPKSLSTRPGVLRSKLTFCSPFVLWWICLLGETAASVCSTSFVAVKLHRQFFYFLHHRPFTRASNIGREWENIENECIHRMDM